MSIRFLNAQALPLFLEKLARQGERKVLTPTRQGKAIVFAPYAGGDIVWDKATTSPKEAVLPRCETLFTYQRGKDPEDMGKSTLCLNDTQEITPTVVFGCRPCDARGFAVLDRPYLQGPHADPYYKARRDALLVITRTCTASQSPCGLCFCHWVGSGPADGAGSDILLTEVCNAEGETVFVLQALTDKGRQELHANDLPQDQTLQDVAEKAQQESLASLPKAPDLTKAATAVAARFTDMDFWGTQTAACLSCGGCTYFCPTCYCFNITDEGDGMGDTPGRRLRSWDTCMASHFTREASGHNPRTLKAQRMRNRVSHKFSNYPQTWDQVFSCNGCGRCISQCPVHLDIRAIVLAAMQY